MLIGLLRFYEILLVVFHFLDALKDVIDCTMSELLLGARLANFVIPATAQMLKGRYVYDLV